MYLHERNIQNITINNCKCVSHKAHSPFYTMFLDCTRSILNALILSYQNDLS